MDLFDIIFVLLLVSLGGIAGYYGSKAWRWLTVEYAWLKGRFTTLELAIEKNAALSEMHVSNEAAQLRKAFHDKITAAHEEVTCIGEFFKAHAEGVRADAAKLAGEARQFKDTVEAKTIGAGRLPKRVERL